MNDFGWAEGTRFVINYRHFKIFTYRSVQVPVRFVVNEKNTSKMLCSISHEECEVPVICCKTGYVYERRVIEKALEGNGGKCPHTQIDLSQNDLILVQMDKEHPTSTPQKTGVPSALQHVQNEWDARSIEVFELRKILQRTRQELATALYRVDAAHRVIAKLQDREKSQTNGTESATEMDRNMQSGHTANSVQSDDQMPIKKKQRISGNDDPIIEIQPSLSRCNGRREVLKTGYKAEDVNRFSTASQHEQKWPDDLLVRVQKFGLQLITARKGRKMSDSWAKAGNLGKFMITHRRSVDSQPGSVTCIEMGRDTDAFVGLSTGAVKRLDSKLLSLSESLGNTHDSKCGGVSCLWWDETLGERIISGGGDGAVRVWNWKELKKIDQFDGSGRVVGLEQHPERSVCLVGSSGGWSWRELASGKVISQHTRDQSKYSSCSIHPDGLMFATGCTDGIVEMWDVGSLQCVNRLGGKGGPVTGIAMSEKGYYMASIRAGTVDLWDLRKPDVVGRVNVGDSKPVYGLELDGLGEFGCAIGTDEVVMFAGQREAKIINAVRIEDDQQVGQSFHMEAKSAKLGVAWGSNAKSVLVGTAGPRPSVLKLSSHLSNEN